MSVARMPRYQTTRPTNFTLTDRTLTKVPFTTIPFNGPSGAFVIPGDSTVTVNWTGLYMIRAALEFGNPPNPWKMAGISLYIDGVFDDWLGAAYGNDTINTRINGTTYKRLTKGQNIGIWAFQAQTIGASITTMAGDAFTSVDVVFMDKV